MGRSLRNKQVPYEVRKEAVLEYLRQSGSWFFNKEWVKKHPQEIDKMADGQKGTNIPNLVASVEYNLTRAANHKEKKGKGLTLRERLKIYQQTYTSYRKEIDR